MTAKTVMLTPAVSEGSIDTLSDAWYIGGENAFPPMNLPTSYISAAWFVRRLARAVLRSKYKEGKRGHGRPNGDNFFMVACRAMDGENDGSLSYDDAVSALRETVFKTEMREYHDHCIHYGLDVRQTERVHYKELDMCFRYIGRLARFVHDKTHAFVRVFEEYDPAVKDESRRNVVSYSHCSRALRKLGCAPDVRNLPTVLLILDFHHNKTIAYRDLYEWLLVFLPPAYAAAHKSEREREEREGGDPACEGRVEPDTRSSSSVHSTAPSPISTRITTFGSPQASRFSSHAPAPTLLAVPGPFATSPQHTMSTAPSPIVSNATMTFSASPVPARSSAKSSLALQTPVTFPLPHSSVVTLPPP
jgi:hypothetical protein